MEEARTGAVATTESVYGGQNSEQPVQAPEPATVFGFAPEDDAAEAAAPQETDQQAGPEEQTADEPGVTEEAAAPVPRTDRRRNAFQRQREELEAKYRNDPARLIGERILKDRMMRDNVDRDTAYRTVNDRLDEAEAKNANVEPTMYRFMRNVSERLGIGEPGTAEGPQGAADARRGAEEPGPESAEEMAASIVDDLMAVQLPRGFDMDAAVGDPAFVDLLAEYPAAAAVRIYQAEHMAPQQVADRRRARQGVPASTRPTVSVRPEPNYKQMSTEDFFKMKERVSKNIY